jgi:hypothetical protein
MDETPLSSFGRRRAFSRLTMNKDDDSDYEADANEIENRSGVYLMYMSTGSADGVKQVSIS